MGGTIAGWEGGVEPVRELDWFPQDWQGSLEGLLYGAYKNAAASFSVEVLAFGMFADYRNYFIKAGFGALFKEPFVAVHVLCGRYGHC